MNVISIRNVSKVFGSGHTVVRAASEISLEVAAGEVILIMGPSGSGKTTLLSMIGTLLTPSGGEIVIDGASLRGMGSSKLATVRLKQLGFIFQSANLISALSAEQNVMLPLIAGGMTKRQAAIRAREMLARFHLEQRLDNLPRQLSGGEKQRVAIARALANDPKVILADEPTASLDSKTGREVMQLLCDVACREGRAVIVVSHDPRLREIANRVITIEDGRLVQEERGDHDPYY